MSWINLPQNSVNVFHLTCIVSPKYMTLKFYNVPIVYSDITQSINQSISLFVALLRWGGKHYNSVVKNIPRVPMSTNNYENQSIFDRVVWNIKGGKTDSNETEHRYARNDKFIIIKVKLKYSIIAMLSLLCNTTTRTYIPITYINLWYVVFAVLLWTDEHTERRKTIPAFSLQNTWSAGRNTDVIKKRSEKNFKNR